MHLPARARRCASAFEAGSEAPAHAAWARASRPSPGRAFVMNCTGSPAIDDASAVGCAMATRAASVRGIGRAEDRKATGEQSCQEKGPHCYLHG